MIAPDDRALAVKVAGLVLAADVLARGGTAKMSAEDMGAAVTTAARLGASLLTAIMRHMPPSARKAEGTRHAAARS